MFDVIIHNNLLCDVTYYYNCMFVSSVKCPLIIVNLNKVMIRNPQQSVGCWIMEKQATLKVWKNDWAVKCWKSCIWDELVLLWVPFCFWVSWNIISWIFMRRNICLSSGSLFIGSQRLIKKWYIMSQSSYPLPIDCIRSSFFLSIIASSNGRFPLLGLVLR